MKKIIAFVLLSFVGIHLTTAQDTSASVEKSVFGAQTGVLGIWAYNELKLADQFALRTEIGLDADFWGGVFNNGNGFLLTPVLTLEPRFYYNIRKRSEKSKTIAGNSGNFISLKTSYHPNLFVISSRSGIEIIPDLSIIPTWGIRRSIGQHFNYEFGVGIGYEYIYYKSIGLNKNDRDATANLHVRIGYQF